METVAHSTQQRLAAVFTILRITMFGALLVIMAGIACPSLAWELPKGTNKIESLTPEQARKLVAEFRPDVHADVPVRSPRPDDAQRRYRQGTRGGPR